MNGIKVFVSCFSSVGLSKVCLSCTASFEIACFTRDRGYPLTCRLLASVENASRYESIVLHILLILNAWLYGIAFFWWSGWNELKCRYICASVGLVYRLVLILPFLSKCTLTSKKLTAD